MIAESYEILRPIAHGGMGIVVCARDIALGRDVAVKLLSPTLLSWPDAVPRFLREARAAAQIQSEHVVRIFRAGQLETGVPYIVMELLSGSDLGDVLQREGPLSIPNAVRFVRQACLGIAEAHALGIVHRDLKPSNLFRVSRAYGGDLIKVLDFGIS